LFIVKTIAGWRYKMNKQDVNFLDVSHVQEINSLILSNELEDFVSAFDEKITIAGQQKKEALIPVLVAIKDDVVKYITHFENDQMSFHDAYEEVTSLYVFTEMYFKLGPQK
jgi:hypothetical protein